MPHAQVRGAQLYYETHGEGEPLILIPGFGVGMWIWFKQVAALAAHFRVIVFDPRGIARSGGGDDFASMGTLAEDVGALLGALGVERAHVVGASFGGFVAQEFALAHPEMTKAL